MKHDIFKEPLIITGIFDVIESSMNVKKACKKKPGRHSDAFVYILNGSCRYTFDDGTVFTAQKGDVLYLAEKAVYNMELSDEIYKFIFCDFYLSDTDSSGVLKTSALRQSCAVTPGDTDEMENYFRRLKNSRYNVNHECMVMCMSLLYHIYGILVRVRHSEYISGSAKERIEEAWNKIHTNIPTHELRVSELAAQAGMSEVYFRKLFVSRYSVTPSKCIIYAKIAYAKKLLNEEILTLEETAIRSGFSSLSYFCKVFKNMTGMTPTEYREKDYI